MTGTIPQKPSSQPTSTAQPLIDAIAQRLNQSPDTLDLRIQIGARVMYGRVSGGEMRDELTPTQAAIILESTQEPKTGKRESYGNKVPGVEIKDGDRTLFRQERDGVVTSNSIQSERDEFLWSLPDPWKEDPATVVQGEIVNGSTHAMQAGPSVIEVIDLSPDKTEEADVAIAVEGLMNPLGEASPPHMGASIGDYNLHQWEGRIEVETLNGTPVATVNGENIEPANADSYKEFLQQLETIFSTEVDGNVLFTHPIEDSPQANPVTPAGETVDQMPQGESKSFLQNLLSDLYAQIALARINLSKLQQETAQVQADLQGLKRGQEEATQTPGEWLFRTVRSGLTPLHQFQRHASALMQDGGLVLAETVGQKLEEASHWVLSRPEAIREQRTARAALQLFNRGHERTGESSYEHGGFRVQRQGQNNFSLQDFGGKELMRFAVERSHSHQAGAESFKIHAKDMTLQQCRSLDTLRRSGSPVMGSVEGEKQYNQKSRQIGALVVGLTHAIGSEVHEGKHYQIQASENGMAIRAKDGRGVIYQERAGAVVHSKLTQQDFGRFDQVLQTIGQNQNRKAQNEMG